ncbi:MAG TPA: ABC transporter permease [Thermoanaerobaculia bacterium]|jgi:putative ABC transport system permease protein|nr:ABC transporter permease [Thermoanaerobaculia bacterium]
MTTNDVGRFAWRALEGYRTRTLLMILATSIGVAAIVVLTSLGEGARRYVRNEFESLGTNLIIIFPGRAETFGTGASLASGRTARDLTLEDAIALQRIRGVEHVAPLNFVEGEVSAKGRRRDVPVAGSTNEVQYIWGLSVASGRFLPPQDPRNATPHCVLGSKVRRELFGADSPLGQYVRLGDRRFRVIGVLAQKGEFVGINMDDIVFIPVASAQALFNLSSLLRIGVMTRSREDVPRVREEIKRLIGGRHGGEQDITVITEDAVSSAFDKVFVALTFALGGIAAISMAVAGILIMNVMLIAVAQRTSEIGLLKALGASPRQIRFLFFAEAALLSAVGGVVGSIIGQLGSFVIRQIYPSVPAFAPIWAVAGALLLAVATGIAFSVLPARRAARLDPAIALARR